MRGSSSSGKLESRLKPAPEENQRHFSRATVAPSPSLSLVLVYPQLGINVELGLRLAGVQVC